MPQPFREPRVVEIEQSLGFIWDRGLFRAQDISNLPHLQDFLESIDDVKCEFVRYSRSELRYSEKLRDRSEAILDLHGPDLYPPASVDRRLWLHDLTNGHSTPTEYYKKDLYYSDLSDRAL